MNLLADQSAIGAGRLRRASHPAGVHRLRCLQGLQQPLPLRVRGILKAQAAPRIAFAGQQGFVKTGRFSKRIAALQQAHQRGRAQLAAAVNIAVLAGYHVGQFAAVVGHAQALANLFQQAGAACFVADMARKHLGRCRPLAQIVAKAGEANGQRRFKPGRHVQHHHQVNAGVYFRVVFGDLRHAPQPVNLRQQLFQCPAGPQNVEQARWLFRHQAARQFLPDPLGYQCVNLAVVHHVLHQPVGLGRDGKIRKAGSQPGHTQNAHRVFAERVGHMAQHFALNISAAVIRIDQNLGISI